MDRRKFLEILTFHFGQPTSYRDSSSYCTTVRYGNLIFYIEWFYLVVSVKDIRGGDMVDYECRDDDEVLDIITKSLAEYV